MMAGPTRAEPRQVTEAAAAGEVMQFNEARSAVAQDLNALITQVAKQVGEEEADIFRAHRALVDDPALGEKVRAAIRSRRVDARTALQVVLDEYAASLARTSDERLKERLADVRDVVSRLQAQLAPTAARPAPGEEKPVVVVASELLPSQVAEFDPSKVLGIVTEFGGPTGHAAILARALGIPAVFGVRGILREVRPGDLIALDGREGLVYLNPGPEVRAAEERLGKEFRGPAIRDLARHVTLKQAQEVLDRVLRLKTARDVRAYLDQTVQAIWPSAALLDTRAEHKQEKQGTS